MAWTYSGDPSQGDKDVVRFLVGDTKEETPLASDEEIQWALNSFGEVNAAAANIALSISFYFATLAESTEIGPIKVNYGKRAELYEKKAQDLLKRSSQFDSLDVYCGGQSVSDKEAIKADPSLVSPYFGRGMMDFSTGYNPRTDSE